MPDPVPTEPGAPAPTSPEDDQVQVELGPDASIYPEALRPPTTPEPPAPPVDAAPEPDDVGTSELLPESAGADESPQQGESRGARRRAAEDAYQRGLSEGRAAYEREQQLRAQADQAQRVQQEAVQRVEQLFQLARSPDSNIQRQAWQQILSMYDGNRQAQQLTQVTRQQVLQEMAADFGRLKDLDSSISDDDYQKLHNAPSVAELGKLAFEFGKRARDEQVAKLEAEVQGLRGRLVGSRATPEPANGTSLESGSGITLEQYQAMSPREAAKLTPSQIDALTAQIYAASEANGRS